MFNACIYRGDIEVHKTSIELYITALLKFSLTYNS